MPGNRREGLFSALAARRLGFQVYLVEGREMPLSREEARGRTIVRLSVVRGLDCGGQRVFHLYGPPGVPLPEVSMLSFLPARPPFSDFRLRVTRDEFGRAVWNSVEALPWTNC